MDKLLQKSFVQKILSLFRNDAFKWLIVFIALLLFAGVPLTALHEQPVYVSVLYCLFIWAILVIVLALVAYAERETGNGDNRNNDE